MLQFTLMNEVHAGFHNLRGLPSVDRVLATSTMQQLLQAYQHDVVVGLVREHLAELRMHLREHGGTPPSLEQVAEAVAQKARGRWRPSPRPVINATGVVIHTNLGRAPLSAEAMAAVQETAGYSNLEFDLDMAQRGSRQAHVERLICHITGAEAAVAVNNNASAVLLGLAALAVDGEVIVSRGEAVEIGGGFRIPDVLRQSGAHLVDVGTTNRTNVEDYERAISRQTAALLRVHPSNFRLTGFTHAPTTRELAALGERYGVPLLYDLGSGCLVDTTRYGLAYEPTVQDSLRDGAALAFFSGDKLLGGPQAGIAAGKAEYVRRLARHPLARAIRMDKLNLAALSATLLHYLKGEAEAKVPIWRMIAMPVEHLEQTARFWAAEFGDAAEVVRGESTIGGGSLPGETLPTWLVALRPAHDEGGVEAVGARLRAQEPAIVGRVEENRLLLDPRTVLPEEDEVLVRGVLAALQTDG